MSCIFLIYIFIFRYLGQIIEPIDLTGVLVHKFISGPHGIDFGLKTSLILVDYNYYMIRYVQPGASKSGTRL